MVAGLSGVDVCTRNYHPGIRRYSIQDEAIVQHGGDGFEESFMMMSPPWRSVYRLSEWRRCNVSFFETDAVYEDMSLRWRCWPASGATV